MLVIQRSADQSFMVGDEVKVTVLEVQCNKVRLGIDAVREIAVHRQEVYDRRLRERGLVQIKVSEQTYAVPARAVDAILRDMQVIYDKAAAEVRQLMDDVASTPAVAVVTPAAPPPVSYVPRASSAKGGRR